MVEASATRLSKSVAFLASGGAIHRRRFSPAVLTKSGLPELNEHFQTYLSGVLPLDENRSPPPGQLAVCRPGGHRSTPSFGSILRVDPRNEFFVGLRPFVSFPVFGQHDVSNLRHATAKTVGQVSNRN